MNRQEILRWLRETDPRALEELFARADAVRRESVGDAVHLRGLVEISNHCRRGCTYCGLAASRDLPRYRMSADEVLACAAQAVQYGYGTVVLQAGEDPHLTKDWVIDVIRRIKDETDLAITLSLGERDDEELAAWRAAGADRYLLRFETSDPDLFAMIHPPRPGQTRDRFAVLRALADMDYEVGSGVMVGIPGQSYEILANDLLAFVDYRLDMIGLGPYIAHPDTPLGRAKPLPPDQQVPASEEMTYKALALARILCPGTNIPSTTALATINLATGREFGLQRGANVVMPNLTPVCYRAHYEIYPSKACIRETAEQCSGCLRRRIESIGRTIGTGRGDSPQRLSRSCP